MRNFLQFEGVIIIEGNNIIINTGARIYGLRSLAHEDHTSTFGR